MKVSGHIAKQRLRMSLKIGIMIISVVLTSMLDNIDHSEMSETEREHWRSVDISSVLINTFRCFLNLVIFLG